MSVRPRTCFKIIFIILKTAGKSIDNRHTDFLYALHFFFLFMQDMRSECISYPNSGYISSFRIR